MRFASLGSFVSSRSRAGRGFLILPIELSLGPSLHPRSSSSRGPRTPATLTSAWMPGLATPPERPRFMCLSPIVASARLSPTRGAMSTTVPTETRSSRRPNLFLPSGSPSSRATAQANFQATPTPARGSSGSHSFGSRTATAESGGSSGGMWWSVTTTSIPSSLASATSRRLEMPQSAVMSRSTPSAKRSRTYGAPRRHAPVREHAGAQAVDLRLPREVLHHPLVRLKKPPPRQPTLQRYRTPTRNHRHYTRRTLGPPPGKPSWGRVSNPPGPTAQATAQPENRDLATPRLAGSGRRGRARRPSRGGAVG